MPPRRRPRHDLYLADDGRIDKLEAEVAELIAVVGDLVYRLDYDDLVAVVDALAERLSRGDEP
jgi:hypothetical protein